MSTSAEEADSGIELTTPVALTVSADPDSAAPVFAETHDGSVQILWTSLNQVWRQVSGDNGITFGQVDFEADGITPRAVADFSNLGNITAGVQQPRSIAAVVNQDGELHLFAQVSDPQGNLTGSFDSDLYYTRLSAAGLPVQGPKALVVGGRTTEGAPVHGVNAYDPRMRQWETVPRNRFDEPVLCNPPALDTDNDGVLDINDNCPLVPNPGQLNSDPDPHGDACDNCPFDYNPSQHDTDNNGVGNMCEIACIVLPGDPTPPPADCDADNDAVPDFFATPDGKGEDNCPVDSNPNQIDSDRDGIGDVCDPDIDHYGRWEHTTATLFPRIYKVGGANAAGLVDHTHFFDTTDGRWYEDRMMPESRAGHSMVVAGGVMNVIGGRNDAGMAAGILQYYPSRGNSYTWNVDGAAECTTSPTSPWQFAPAVSATLLQPRQNGAAVVVPRAGGDEIHYIGGRTTTASTGSIVGTVESFRSDGAGNLTRITSLPPLPFVTAEHAAVFVAAAQTPPTVGDAIYVFGGTNNGIDPNFVDIGAGTPDLRALVWRIDLQAAPPAVPQWILLSTSNSNPGDAAPRPRRQHTASLLNGKIYLMGGIGLPDPGTVTIDPITLVDVFDPATESWSTDPESLWPNPARGASAAVFDEASFPRNLSRQAGVVSQIDATMDPVSRDLYVAWRNEYLVGSDPFQLNTLSNLHMARSRDNGVTFMEPVRISNIGGQVSLINSQFREPRIAVGPSGAVHVAWMLTGDPTQIGGSPGEDLVYAVCPRSNTAPTGLACPTQPTGLHFPLERVVINGAAPAGVLANPELAVDSAGNAYLAWINAAGTIRYQTASANEIVVPGVYLARRNAGGSFSSPILLSTHMEARREAIQELFPEADIQQLLADLAAGTSSPTLTTEPGGGVDVMWSNGTEVLIRRSRDGVRFLDERSLVQWWESTLPSLTMLQEPVPLTNAERRQPGILQAPSGDLVLLWHTLADTTGQGDLSSHVFTALITPTAGP
ncbi:MAG: thrombospondin type 3 repeat-containing protein [Nitrospirota bacterium]|nr:thrombospondin type 3 repeat-containing protein [Nitrospirota bacterium]